MDAKGEARALEDEIRHAKEFRKKHSIPDAEWENAEEILKLWQRDLLLRFYITWKTEFNKEEACSEK